MNIELVDRQRYVRIAELLLAAESRRIYDLPLEGEQVDALVDQEQCFEMLDDMESRMGFDVVEARHWLVVAHDVGHVDKALSERADSVLSTLEAAADAGNSLEARP